jgi:C4-dicarboxylate transporter, DctM subunit
MTQRTMRDWQMPFAVLHVLFSRCAAFLAAAATAWIFVLMLLICADVLALAILNSPIYGVIEITGASIVAIVFAQLPHTLVTHSVTRADFFYSSLVSSRPSVASALDLFFCLAGVVVFALIGGALWHFYRTCLAVEGNHFAGRLHDGC